MTLERWISEAGRVLRRVLRGRSSEPRDFLLEVMPSGGKCAEIGVDRGDFSRRILDVNRPEELHLIDPWRYRVADGYSEARYGGERGGSQDRMDAVYRSVRQRFSKEIEDGAVHIHRDVSSRAAQRFPEEYFDWIYIDGNHLYDRVREDLRLFVGKVKYGGYLAGDDYGVQGWWEDGVTRAVDEFVESGEVEPVTFRDHQFILRRT